MATKNHDDTVNNHSPYDLIYLNAADREAGVNETRGKTVTAEMADPPRKALQLDNYSEYILVNHDPITYVAASTTQTPISTDVLVYVDGTNGDDSNDGSISDPFRTVDRALRDFIDRPLINNSEYRVRFSEPGIYDSCPQFVNMDIYQGSRLVMDASGLTPELIAGPFTVTSVTPVGDVSPDGAALATDLGVSGAGWTVNEHYTYVVHMTSGNWNNYRFSIQHNGTDYIRVFPDWYGFAPGDTFNIVREPVEIRTDHKVKFSNRHTTKYSTFDNEQILCLAGIRFNCTDTAIGSALEIDNCNSFISFCTAIGNVFGLEVLYGRSTYINYVDVDPTVFDGGPELADYFSVAFGVWPEGGSIPTAMNRTVYLFNSATSLISTSGNFYVEGDLTEAIFSHCSGVENQGVSSCICWALFINQWGIADEVFYNQNGTFFIISAWIDNAGVVIESKLGGSNRADWLKGNPVSNNHAVELACGSTVRQFGGADVTITGAVAPIIFDVDGTSVQWADGTNRVRLPATWDDGSRVVLV